MFSSKKNIPALDVLRTLAILLVFIWHYQRYGTPDWLVTISSFGWTGVDLFFVLSGFLIGSQLFSQLHEQGSISVKQFYLKRFFRIIPAYAAVLVVYFSLPAFHERNAMAPAWKFFTFSMNYGLDFLNAGTFSHAWSLCIEEQFYLLFPVIVFALSRLQNKRIVMLLVFFIFLGGFFIRAFVWNTYIGSFFEELKEKGELGNIYSKFIYYPTHNRLDGLLCGVSIALLYVFSPRFKEYAQKFSWFFFVAGLLTLTGVYFLCLDSFTFEMAVFSYPLVSLGYGMLLIAGLNAKAFINRKSFWFFSILATLSYSFYLVHKQLNHIAQHYMEGRDYGDNLEFFICLGVSTVGAVLLHLIVEKPFLLLRRKILKET